MKKLNKLCAILFAVLGVTTLKAQTDVTDKYLLNPSFEYADKDKNPATATTTGNTAVDASGVDAIYGWTVAKTQNFYLANKDANQNGLNMGTTVPSDGNIYYFNRQGWIGNGATYEITTETRTLPAGKYYLCFDYKAADYYDSRSDLQNTSLTLSILQGDKELTSSGAKHVAANNKWSSANPFTNSSWNKFGLFFEVEADGAVVIKVTELLKAQRVAAVIFDNFRLYTYDKYDVTESTPLDLTGLIHNQTFLNADSWVNSSVKNGGDFRLHTGVGGKTCWNSWSNNFTSMDIHQDLSDLPNGLYQVSCYGITQTGFINDQHAYAKSTIEKKVSPNMTIDNGWNTPAGWEFLTTEKVKVNDGKLTIGMESTSGGDRKGWFCVSDYKLTYLGPDLDFSKELLASTKEQAEKVLADETYAGIIGEERAVLSKLKETIPTEETPKAYDDATENLKKTIQVFINSKENYEALATEKKIAAGLGMSEESIASATATTKTGIVALQDLKVAEYNYIQSTYTENATLGSWTETFAEDLNGEGYKTNGSTYFNEWGNATRTAKQTVKLTAGDYAISGIGRGQVGTSGYLYYKIGEETTQVDFIMKGNRGRGVDVNGVANFSEEGEYNCNGEGYGWEYRFITFHLDTETEVEIGVSATFANAWVSIYAPVLLTTESSVKALRMTEIANLLSTVPTGKMNATVQSTLDEKKDAAEAASAEENTIDELSTIATELNEAIIAANTSIAEYEKIATYIAKANTIDESIAADVQTQYDNGILDKAEPVFQALEVATYNYVKNEFSYPVELPEGNWIAEGPTGSKSEQHWSGENRSYLEQSGAAWGQNAWSISYKQTKKLPAGDYVFKVSGRRAAGTGNTLSLIVTNINDPENPVELGMVNDFPEGDTGLGINKNGETSFKADDEAGFANNNAGRGWQWRYVKFTLTSETAVQVAVEAEATTNHQWISFCDATLQMTEETYLEANKGGLDAPTAAAEALVDTKPMGTAENQALKDALALPVTTGAELLAKIDALNAAVANANAWIAEYNTAKAPLVAALERFETDYNDAENGALDHMCKSRWTTAVDMAQAAAVAKDATDSYEGFATATENLVAALDAATVSVGEYTALKTAIDEATPYLGGNDWGSEPFQKPESAKDDFNEIKTTAQNAYDAAEVDGEGVTAVIESLNTAINDVVLNAPEEGQRFYIKVATEGHGKNDNAWLMTLGNTGDNNRTGYGINANNAVQPHLNQAFIFTQVEGNLYNISIERPEGTVYLTYGSLNESAAGWKNQQIQATTDAEKKGEFKIVPTGKNGILKIFNTVDNNYLDCQDGGSIYTDTDISKEEFAFELATEHSVTLKISDVAGWATLILPFNAEIPEGVKAYTSVALDGESVELVQVSEGGIKANTPYLIKGTGEYTFSGYGLADKDSYEDENGLFVGTYVDYATTGGEYVLQKQKHDDKVGFYVVGESVKPTVKAYRCYLTAPASEIKAFFFFDDDATGINDVDDADIEIEAIYTINGAKVNSLQKGLNIVKMSNGKVKKVFVK